MPRDGRANLRRGLAQLGLLVGEKSLLGADVALGRVRGLIATAQAGVAQGTVTAAIARQLINDATNLGSQLIGMQLPGVTEVFARQLRAVEYRRQCVDVERRRGVISGNVVRRVGPLRITGRGERENSQAPRPTGCDRIFH